MCTSRVPRKLLKLKIVELTEGCTKLHDEVLISFTPHKILQGDQIKSIQLARLVTLLEGRRVQEKCLGILVGKHDGMRSL